MFMHTSSNGLALVMLCMLVLLANHSMFEFAAICDAVLMYNYFTTLAACI